MKDQRTNDLLDSMMKCITACENCADACLEESNVAEMMDCIRLDRDCADICTITARFIGRGSSNAPALLQQCITLCKACEQECSKHQHAHCIACAEACKECRELCEEYSTVPMT